MRFLPTIEVRNQIIQVALPDVHAIALAETCLISERPSRLQSQQELLMTSPMLLFWVFQKWNSQHHHERIIPIHDTEFASQLTSVLDANSRSLVRDHAKPLSSVQRIESDPFLDFQSFFSIRKNENHDFTVRLLERIAVLQSLVRQKEFNVDDPSTDVWSIMQTEFNPDPIIKQFSETDFQHCAARDLISAGWMVDLPFFCNGFDDLDNKLDRLEKLEKSFDDEVERAKVGAVQQLAYGASHEVNNPLANISTRAQALLRDETDPKRRQRLMTIDAQAFRAHDMISNLMTFAKPRRPVFERVQLHPIAKQAINSLTSLALENEIIIENEVEHSVYFDADKEQVKEIIFSLVQNAIEAIRHSGNIRVKSSVTDQHGPVQIEVLDSGPGISPEVRRHIFDPFFSGREAGRGLGFGMPKVWRLMELHGGSVRITEKNGKTCIELLFPLQQPAISSLENPREKTA